MMKNECVRLWEGGPFWALANLGSSRPEEAGLCFWWGDTLGWTKAEGFWLSGDGKKSAKSKFGKDCPAYKKTCAALSRKGWIKAGALAAARDAAAARLGAGWRLPTIGEFGDLIKNCDNSWERVNGVFGRVFRGRGAFAASSIFLPVTGFCRSDARFFKDVYGHYWSATPGADDSCEACSLCFYTEHAALNRDSANFFGFAVRPVRDGDCGDSGRGGGGGDSGRAGGDSDGGKGDCHA